MSRGTIFLVAATVWLCIEVHLWNLEKSSEPPTPEDPWIKKMMRYRIKEIKEPLPNVTPYVLIWTYVIVFVTVTVAIYLIP